MATKTLSSKGGVKTIPIQTADTAVSDDHQSYDIELLIGEKRGKHAITVYRGVVVFWSGKEDKDVLRMIDGLKPVYRGRLVLVRLQDDALSFAWRGTVPPELAAGESLKGPAEGQEWTIERSIQVA